MRESDSLSNPRGLSYFGAWVIHPGPCRPPRPPWGACPFSGSYSTRSFERHHVSNLRRVKIPFRLRRSRVASAIRDLAHRSPDEAEEYLDTHQAEWERIAEVDPHSAADILEALDEEGAADLLEALDADDAADILDEMRPEPAADVLEEVAPSEAAGYIAEMETDQAVDLLAALEEDSRNAVLAALDPDTRREINRLIIYPPDSAGGLMTTEIASLPRGVSAGEAIESLRSLHDELGSNLTYVYVVDDAGHLIGVAPFRELVFARPGTGLEDVMVSDPVAVQLDTDREIVAELIQRYHLIAIPVTDADGHLIGMVKVDEALEAVQAEAGEDITQMVGAGPEETVFSPIPRSVQRRLPWIVLNLFIGLGIAFVINHLKDVIETRAILAAYMPLVAQLGGNTGAQSLAVTIRSMAVGDLPRGRALKAIRRELLVTTSNGLVMSVLSGLMGGLVSGDARIGLIISIAVIINLMVAGLVGSAIPLLLRRFGQDPALASNIFLTAVTDTVGFSGFLITATLIL